MLPRQQRAVFMSHDPIAQRKTDHLDITTHGDIGFHQTTTLFEQVHLIHDALPEISWEEVDTSCQILGKNLRVPLIIAAMTGGTARAQAINEHLASIAEKFGCGFGLGSQSPMVRDPQLRASFAMRRVAPQALILGNIGAVQATKMSQSELRDLVDSVEADALCVHLNPAMELIQAEGDRDFRGILSLFERLVRDLGVPVVAKETGCGISAGVSRRLRAVGVCHLDVSGAGGTSWVAVESERAAGGEERSLGRSMREWGIPTAASVVVSAAAGFHTIFATGGVATGLDIAKALALGASAAGVARPVLQALDARGQEGVLAYLQAIERELRVTMLLVGARRIADLRSAPRVVDSMLSRWILGMGGAVARPAGDEL